MLYINWLKLLSMLLGGMSVGLGEAIGVMSVQELLRRKGIDSLNDLKATVKEIEEFREKHQDLIDQVTKEIEGQNDDD